MNHCKHWMLLAALSAGLVTELEAQDEVRGVPYVKQESRAATERAMLSAFIESKVTWGDWYQLVPFPFKGHGENDLMTPHPPEQELAGMVANSAGPDLGRRYVGKLEREIGWEPLGDISNRPIHFNTFEDTELNDNGVAYLYGTVEASQETTIDVTMGSDDGLRFWLNGKLLVDKDVPRGLTPDADHVRLELAQGTNHILLKVSQGAGGWAYQINTRQPLDPVADAQLYYFLDRDFPVSREGRYYKAITIPVPDDVVLEVGGLAFYPDGRPAVCTRRGDVFLVQNAYSEPPQSAQFQLFATGLHEPLGLAVRSEDEQAAVYSVQRGEMTRLVDEDGDDRADLYQTFCDEWGLSGNYHEFAFGPKFDTNGDAWVTLNIGFCGSLGKSIVPWRGWALKIDAEGKITPVCGGLRSPNGIGLLPDGSAFYLDNQGDYVGTNKLAHLKPGSWHGHPSGLRWREDWEAGDPDPPRLDAAVWFPYGRMGQSTADLALDRTGGRFGPFEGQFFVGDQTNALVSRVFLEQVGDTWQGACFPFRANLDCGVNRVAFAADGSLFVGQTDRGWGSIGRKRYGLQRIVWTGETPFEVREMRAHRDGFELEFTSEMDRQSALALDSYRLVSFTYSYHAQYGSPEIDKAERSLEAIQWIDKRTVLVRVPERKLGYVHELHYAGVRSKSGEEPLHSVAYYTLQAIPKR